MRRLALVALLVGCLALGACANGTKYTAAGTPPDPSAAEQGGGGGHSHGGGHIQGGGASASETDAGAGGGEHAADGGQGGHTGHDAGSGEQVPDGGGGGAAQDEMAGMKTLAVSQTGDVAVELHTMAPELFYVSEGDGFRPQRPTERDDVHLMVTLADRTSGVRLPDASVTARLTDKRGQTVFEGPLYPMVGRGMGLHYGENVPVGRSGAYEVTLTIGPPRVGRHRAVSKAWQRTTSIRQRVVFNGRTLAPA